MDEPAPPPGFAPVAPPPSVPPGMFAGKSPKRASAPVPLPPPPPPGFAEVPSSTVPTPSPYLAPTGVAHDGDTFRLTDGRNARLYGADAFELGQTGRAHDGTIVPLGVNARDFTRPYLTPDASLGFTGAQTYGRPVTSLTANGHDLGHDLINSGNAWATPQYLGNDPARRQDYMEAERLARLNYRGGFATDAQNPSDYRHGRPPSVDPWAKPVNLDPRIKGGDVVWWDEPTPFQGLRPDVEKGYVAVLDDPKSTPADALSYAQAQGFQIDPAKVATFYRKRAKGYKNSGVVGAERAPRVLTDLHDGAFGATMRGVADPFNMLDEAGGLADALTPNVLRTKGQERENIWNSDRRFGDVLWNNIEQNRQILDHDEAVYPWQRFGGQMAGGLVIPGGAIEDVGFVAARKVIQEGGTRFAAQRAATKAIAIRLGTVGSVEAGVSGFGSGETLPERFTNAAIAAPFGGVLGVTTPFAINGVTGAVRRFVGRDLADTIAPRLSAAARDDAPTATPAGEPGPTITPRQQDILGIAPSRGEAPTPAPNSPIDTSPPVRATPPPRSLDDVEPDIRNWAADQGVTPHDGDGLPPVMLHGSPYPKIDEFDPYGRSGYGLFGSGTYLTDNPRIAAQYSKKGLGQAVAKGEAERSVYAVEQKVTNPLDMDAPADISKWSKVADEYADFHDGMTNEQAFRAVEDGLMDQGDIPKWEGVEIMHDMVGRLGHDGITHVGGGRVGDGPRHRVVIALHPEQTSIRGRLSVDSLLNPPAPRSPDWIDIGGTSPGNAGRVEPVGRYSPTTMPMSSDIPNATMHGPSFEPTPPAGYRPVDPAGGSAAARPLLADATDAQRIAQGQRVAPNDFLPLSRDRPLPSEGGGETDPTPNFAGNINLDHLDSPQSIDRALKATDQQVGGFDAATRGRMAQSETERLAADLGMTAQDLLARRKGQAFNAEQALAARQILAKSGNELVNLAKRVKSSDNPGDEALAAFRQAWTRHVAIQEQVAGATAEAGRALAQFRMSASSRAVRGDVLRVLAEGPNGTDRLKQAADLILDNAGDPASLNTAAQRALKPRFSDKLVELYYNSILSGPQTHVVNMLSNTMTVLGQFPEHAAAAAIGAPRAAFRGADADRVLFSELGARAVGMVQGAKEGVAQALRTFRTGDAADLVSKVESHESHAISGIKGSIIRTPTRALSAEDELFKAVARRMELSGLAVRQAGAEGLSGSAATTRAAELLANPTDDMLEKSFDYGRYLTFQRQLGPIGQKISGITQTMPALKLILPFVRTPTNILKFAIERSPAAPLLKEWRMDMAAGGARRDLAIAKVAVGSGAMALVTQMAGAGNITGGGPADDSATAVMRADGWQPYSVKIGGKYYSYQRLDPFSTTLGIAADFADLQSHMTDKQKDEVAGLLVASTLKNLASKTWFSGVSDLSQAIDDPERYGSSYIRNRVASIAVPAIVAQGARSLDPNLRQAKTMLDAIRARIPGMSSQLPPKLDVWGRPITNEGGLGPNFVSPIWESTAKNDPVNAAVLGASARVSAPSRKLGDRQLSDAEYNQYAGAAGQLAHDRLGGLVSGPGWSAVPPADRADMIEEAVRKTRREVREGMFGATPRRSRGQLSAGPPPPPGFAPVPPPPPGFSAVR